MKALTICQPFAHLIALGTKRVENRTWPTHYRGPLLIHAGRSRDWLVLENDGRTDSEYGIYLHEMAFGAVVATCRLDDCVRITDAGAWRRHPWLHEHTHASGPWCWILANVKRLEQPVPALGKQGLFDIDWPPPPPERTPGG